MTQSHNSAAKRRELRIQEVHRAAQEVTDPEARRALELLLALLTEEYALR